MFKNLSLWVNVMILAGAAIAVWAAGSRLVRHADALADRTGLNHALVGMLLLGVVTSLPELTVAVTATFSGAPLLTVNNILGAAAINLLLLALADVIYGRDALTATPGSPQVLLQGALSAALLVLVPAAFVVGDTLVLGVGAWGWTVVAGYGLAIWTVSRARNMRSWVPDPQRPAHPGPPPSDEPGESKGRLFMYIGVSCLVILAAGFLLARSADAIAVQTGLGTSFVGAVLLGLCTALPEASTVTAAVRRGRYEMAIGEVFGTNLFNVTILALVDALHPGDPVLPAAGAFAAFAALMAILMTLTYLAGIIERRDRTVLRMGPDSLAVVVIYAVGVTVLYRLR